MMEILRALMVFGLAVVGDPPDATGHFGIASIGAPDEVMSGHARKLGRRVAQLAQKLSNEGKSGY